MSVESNINTLALLAAIYASYDEIKRIFSKPTW